jgi:two-component system catabolic regulation response regulator CreB/two-component system response regulator ChvI
MISGRILLIDDSRDLTDSIKIGLRGNEGIRVDSYNDPVEAALEFRAGVYDLVFLAMRMPKMNGFQVYRELKKIDADIPICFLTSFDVHESEFSLLFPGMNAQQFMTKPITIRALKSKVTEMLNFNSNDTNIDRFFGLTQRINHERKKSIRCTD